MSKPFTNEMSKKQITEPIPDDSSEIIELHFLKRDFILF